METRGIQAVHLLWKGTSAGYLLTAHPPATFRLCLPTQLFFFFSPLSVHFLVHPWKHITTLLWKKTFLSLSPSLSELEGRDATGVGGNFPTEAFLSSRKCLFKLRRVLCECKNCAHHTLGGFIVSSPKNPTLQVLHFLATTNSLFFFFFHRGKIWVETPKLSKKNTRTEVA